MSKGKEHWRELDVSIWRAQHHRRKGEDLTPLEKMVLEAWDKTGNLSYSDMFDLKPWIKPNGEIVFRNTPSHHQIRDHAKYMAALRDLIRDETQLPGYYAGCKPLPDSAEATMTILILKKRDGGLSVKDIKSEISFKEQT